MFFCSFLSRDVARKHNSRDIFSVHHLLLIESLPYQFLTLLWPILPILTYPSNKIKEIKGEWRINFLLDAKFYTRIVSV